MKHLFSTLILAATAFAAQATLHPIAVNSSNPNSSGYSFRYLTSDNPQISKNINDYLFIHYFETLSPKNFSVPLKPDPESPASGIASLELGIATQTGQFLTIRAQTEWCGAYCEESEENFSFDLSNGQHITFDDLFLNTAKAQLLQRLNQRADSLYNEQIQFLQQEIQQQAKQKNAPQDELLEPQLVLELMQQCLEEEYHDITTPELFLGKEAITITKHRCSSHAMRAVDEVGDIATVFSISQLKPYLSDYGKALFSLGTQAKPQASFFDKIMRGTINGSYPITLWLTRQSDNTIVGTYYYDKHGKPLRLSGTLHNSKLALKEDGGTIDLSLSDTKGSGTWKGNGKSLPMEIHWP